MGILSGLVTPPELKICHFNTSSLYDYWTGDAIGGHDGKFYIRGGLGPFVTGITGRGGTFKSTVADGLVARAMALYPESEAIVVDTEGVKDVNRIITCAGELGEYVDPNRIELVSGVQYDIQALWKLIQEIGAKKDANKKDLTIETPFVDLNTGKRIRTWVPTFLFIDSFSEMYSTDEKVMLEEKGMDDKKIKTVWMTDGNKKTLLMRHIRMACETWGIIVVAIAQMGDNMEMDSYMPPSKQLQHMKQKDKLKNVGSKFTFLTRNLCNVVRCAVLADKDEPVYGDLEGIPAKDINEVSMVLTRGKNSMSGGELPFVVSQSCGLQMGLTHYHYIRSNEYFGLVGSKQSHASALYPSVKVNRNTATRQMREDPKLSRAMELCAQLFYIKNNWRISQNFPSLSMTPEQLFEALQKNSCKVDDILASRGCWTTRKDDRPYMSILDVLDLVKS